MKLLVTFVTGLIGLFAIFWLLSSPSSKITPKQLAGLTPKPAHGQQIFHVSGCASCHSLPSANDKSDKSDDALPLLGGGKRFVTEFGTFIAPNISSDKTYGIGSWTTADFANAMIKGLSPDSRHYYPAFPYASYTRMSLQDLVDLKGFMDTLPASQKPNESHDLAFPFSVRRGVGLWKQLYLSDKPVVDPKSLSEEQQRGQYLVETLGHCGECHTARNFAGAMDKGQWLQGSVTPEGNKIPAIAGIDWDVADIAEYLSSGFTPEYDVAGGEMAEVIANTRHLSKEDRLAMGAYLKALKTQP